VAVPVTNVPVNPQNPPQPPPRGRIKKKRSRRSEWEILEGLKDGQTYDRG